MIIGLLLLVAGGFVVYNMLTAVPEPIGTPVDPGVPTVKVSDLAARPGEYVGQLVAVEGRSSLVCGTGCWLYLKGADGQSLYVDLAPASLSIPPKANMKLRIYGTMVIEDNNAKFNGIRVEFKR